MAWYAFTMRAMPQPPPPCLACGLPPPLCPASVPPRCAICHQVFAPGIVGYPGVTETAAETWTPPGRAVTAGVLDAEGHPLTWGCVAAAHEWLVHHAFCEQQAAGAGGYSSDDESDAPTPCPCTWHPVAIEERESHQYGCRGSGRARSAAPAGRPAALAGTCLTTRPTRTRVGRTAVCAATLALERARGRCAQAAPAPAPGGPRAPPSALVRTPRD